MRPAQQPARGPDDEFLFARFTPAGAVHVLAGHRQTFDDSPVAALLSGQRTMCGVTGRSGQLHGISEFHDDELCRRCYHLCDGDDSLFEHPTPAESDEDIWALLADVRFVFWTCDRHPDTERHLVEWDRDPTLGMRPRCLTCGNEGAWR